MSEEIDILKLVCQRLEQVDVPYMLTGSFAANFYAVPSTVNQMFFELFLASKPRG